MITIATDGSCIGNPGPGAYGFVAETEQGLFPKAIPVAATTVGEMEVRALLEALLYYIANHMEHDTALIKCDSEYVVKGYNDWIEGWQAKGWRKSKGQLAHVELWKRIADAKATVRHNVKVEWVRAHQNTGSLNDKVDALVNKCARTQEACNGPSLQDGTAQATGTIISDMAGATIGPPPAATKPVEPHDVVRLVSLLREARDMIDHLARPSDTGAHELSAQIADALEKA